MAKVLTTAELLSNTARLKTTLLASDAHTAWTEASVLAHMKTEAAKYRPNLLYYVVRALPPYSESNLGVRMDYTILGLLGLSFIGFLLGVVAFWGLWLFGSLWWHTAFTVALTSLVTGILLVVSISKLELAELTVVGPATWKTKLFDAMEEGAAPEDVRGVARAIREFIPGVRLEISLLSQGKWKLDPVLWAVVATDVGDIRIPLRVWDENGRAILPH